MKPCSGPLLIAILAGLGPAACQRSTTTGDPDAGPAESDARFLYVCDDRWPGIHSFRIDEATGAVAPAATSSVELRLVPRQLVVLPSGRIAYGLPGELVTTFALARDGGVRALPSPPAERPRASKLLIAPDGRHLYTLHRSTGVAAFEIGASGALAAVGAPLSVGQTALDFAFDPSGRALHVLVRPEAYAPQEVLVLGVDPTGGGLTPSTVPPLKVGHEASAIRVHPSGRFACVVSGGFNGKVAMYAVDPASGALTLVRGSPFDAGAQAARPEFHPSGRFLYVAASAEVWAYAVDSAGGLRRLSGSPFGMGEVPWYFGLDPEGRFLYTASPTSSGGRLGVWAIDPEQGTFSSVAGSPFTCGKGPVFVARRPGAAVPVASLPAPAVAEAGTDSAAAPGPANSFGLAEATVAQLAVKLRDPDWRVRYYAAVHLSQKASEATPAVPFLIAALRDPNETVVKQAAYALETIGPDAASAAPALVELLRSDKLSYREAAASALGKIGSAEAKGALAEALGREDYGSGARREAARALGEVGAGPEQVPALLKAIAEGDSQTRKASAEALGSLGAAAQPAVPELIALLDHDRPDVRRTAAEVLGRIGPGAGASVPILYGTLQDRESSVRDAASRAIRSIRRGVPAAAY